MKSYWGRLLTILVLGGYFIHCATTPAQWHFIDVVDLIFHEAGHTIFMQPLFGQFIHVLMGSGFQVLLPLAIAGYFYYTRQRLGAGVALMWTGQSLVNVSVYADDAIAQQLPLLGGDGVHHDWNYLFSAMHVLPYTEHIALGMYVVACCVILAGIILACTTAPELISDPEFHSH